MQARRKVVGLCAAALALTAVVGAGFSAWVFNGSAASASAELGVYVTGAEGAMGTLEISDSYRLVLDQGGADYKADATKGIYVMNTNTTIDENTELKNESITATWTVATAEVTNATITYTLNVYVLEGTFSNYVQLVATDTNGFTEGESDKAGYIQYTKTLSEDAISDTVVDADTVYTITYTPEDELFQYYGNADVTTENGKAAKPQDLAAYKTMMEAITEQTYTEDAEGYDSTTPNYVIFEFSIAVE